MFSGISFQTVGEAIENLRDDETVRARGTARRSLPADRRFLDGTCSDKMLAR